MAQRRGHGVRGDTAFGREAGVRRAKAEATASCATSAEDTEMTSGSRRGRAGAMLDGVKAARAKIVKGKIVTRARFPEGARLTILMDDARPPIELEPEDEEAMLRGLESIRAGKGVPLDAFRAMLRRT